MRYYLSLFIVIAILGNIYITSGAHEHRYVFVPSENAPEPEVFFCMTSNCTAIFLDLIRSHDEIHCALYDLDLPDVISALEKKHASVVVDNDNSEGIELTNIREDTSSQLSHNKFCVFDSKIVFSGSWNPTFNGAYRNDNNIVIVNSSYLAANYIDEWDELWNHTFGRGKEVTYSRILLNNKLVENYFCPEDHCKSHILSILNKAKYSIYFMTFSFTDKDIAQKLIDKADEGLNVIGIMEKQRISNRYNLFSMLNGSCVEVMPDKNNYIMHHKVFIIDNDTVITGSFNPTKSADEKNDENILVFHDMTIANKFLSEFERLSNNIS